MVQSGISLVSIDQARLNLTTELDPFNWDFERVVQNQKQVWNELLSKIAVKSTDTLALTKFYTNLYRAYAARNVWSDVNGKYRDACENIRTVEG
ncbi:MAG: glycoside hydrolase family 92 protein, partial [Mameliella sp.]|nr:glycoside hydrolase family 92 protein [Phaeodactylibacter sp.]